eukprot:jgi/Tetstr1/435111/TSEL_024079.t1
MTRLLCCSFSAVFTPPALQSKADQPAQSTLNHKPDCRLIAHTTKLFHLNLRVRPATPPQSLRERRSPPTSEATTGVAMDGDRHMQTP